MMACRVTLSSKPWKEGLLQKFSNNTTATFILQKTTHHQDPHLETQKHGS